MVEVEQRALGTLEQDVLATRQGGLHEPGGVVEVHAQALAPGHRQLDQRFDREGGPAHRSEHQVLVGQDALEPLVQDGPIEEILHAQADPPGTIAVGRSDPPTGRADLGRREPVLVALIEAM